MFDPASHNSASVDTRVSANKNPSWSLFGQTDSVTQAKQVELNVFPCTIGRGRDAVLRLQEACISKEHAVIDVREGRLILTDLKSTNGTFVNGQRVLGETELQKDDLVHFAALVFRVGVRNQEDNLTTNTVSKDYCDNALALIQFERLISESELYPHFQPIVSMADQSSIGYEVLGRSRLFGLESPDEMFAAASQLNLEAELSEAFRQRGVETGTAFGAEKIIFVNTHPKELGRKELYESLRHMRVTAPEQQIALEIHEGASTNLGMMRELRAVLDDLAIKLAFDDFGVGRARLVELGDVRPDFLKFDMKLTRNIENAPSKRQELVALFSSMVNSLGIDTIAEGVETRESHDILAQMGIQFGQGFYYGRPSPLSKYQPTA